MINLKILLLGKGVANNGCERLLKKHNIDYDYLEKNEVQISDYDLIVKSPGIPLDDIVFTKIKGKVITDIELAYRLEKPNLIGVTGSNGKTTVVTMLAHVLKSKYNTIACGNIGYSICDALVDHPNMDFYIVELSSFQLEGVTSVDFMISCILNISLCHIDHHKSFDSYIESKLNICKYQGYNHYFVYNAKEPYFDGIRKKTNAKCIDFSYHSTIHRIYFLNGYIYKGAKKIYRVRKNANKLTIENILACLTIASVLNVDIKSVAKKIRTYKKEKYRLEEIRKCIFNDAKSTNCASTECALESLRNVILICGGYDRSIEINLSKVARDNIEIVLCYGQTKQLVKNYFEKYSIPVLIFDKLKDAVIFALKIKKENTILYSPMFASFDQYKSYIERGLEFEKLINNYYEK